MNTSTVVLGGIVVALLLGGFVLFTNQNMIPPPNATSTPTNNENTTLIQPSASAPNVVTDQAVAPSNSTAVVTGKVTPSGAPTTYWYEYGESTSLGGKTSSQSIGSGFSAIASPAYITGLKANTLYFFRLSAKNAQGTANGTTYSFSTNNNPPTQGTPPTANTDAAGDVARTSATLNARVNPRSSATTYWFEYGVSADFGRVTGLKAAGSGNVSMPVSVPVSDLNAQTKYYFRINAQNQYGTVNGNTQAFTTKGPGSPSVPAADTTSATNLATSSATLHGTINPNGAETTYRFEYSTDALLGSILGTVSGTQPVGASVSSISVNGDATGLSKKTTYYFRLVVQNQYGTTRGDIESFRTRP